jgi:hypothetical protein
VLDQFERGLMPREAFSRKRRRAGISPRQGFFGR